MQPKFEIMPEKKKPGINTIGHIAFETIGSNTNASVIGITSKGLFAAASDKQIIFFTNEKYHGPLTINLSNFNHRLPEIGFSAALELSARVIRFTNEDISLRIGRSTPIWSPPIVPQISPSPVILLQRAESIESLFDWRSSGEFSLKIATLYKKIKPDFISGKFNRTAEELEKVIGYGTGLTPSGDDFICGFLLAAYYWHKQLLPNFPFEKINGHLRQIAAQTTTSLSNNLITCAAQGSANERILACLLWLNDGNGDIETILKELRLYGSSSGSDTLHGMLMFIRAAFSHKE